MFFRLISEVFGSGLGITVCSEEELKSVIRYFEALFRCMSFFYEKITALLGTAALQNARNLFVFVYTFDSYNSSINPDPFTFQIPTLFGRKIPIYNTDDEFDHTIFWKDLFSRFKLALYNPIGHNITDMLHPSYKTMSLVNLPFHCYTNETRNDKHNCDQILDDSTPSPKKDTSKNFNKTNFVDANNSFATKPDTPAKINSKNCTTLTNKTSKSTKNLTKPKIHAS